MSRFKYCIIGKNWGKKINRILFLLNKQTYIFSTDKKYLSNEYFEDLKIKTRKFSDYHFLLSNESKKYVESSSSSSKSGGKLVDCSQFPIDICLSILSICRNMPIGTEAVLSK